MRGMVPVDPQTSVSQVQFALVYVPNKGASGKKRRNKRFPASCVEVKESKEIAIDEAKQDVKKYAAIVVGPSKSSEGQYIYYLQEWLAS
ncbi:MAG: hypothetical protein V3V19_07200 [Cocleimonas sp.]